MEHTRTADLEVRPAATGKVDRRPRWARRGAPADRCEEAAWVSSPLRLPRKTESGGASPAAPGFTRAAGASDGLRDHDELAGGVAGFAEFLGLGGVGEGEGLGDVQAEDAVRGLLQLLDEPGLPLLGSGAARGE